MQCHSPSCHVSLQFEDENLFHELECPSCGSSFRLISDDAETKSQGGVHHLAHFELLKTSFCRWCEAQRRLGDVILSLQIPLQGSHPLKFLERLFAKPKPKQILTDRLFGPETFGIDVASLSTKNLNLFWKATSNQWRPTDEVRVHYELQTDATLVSDDQNPLPHAICVEIAGKVVGKMENPDALRLYRALNDLGYDRIRAICKANIVGRIGYWQVNLDLDLGLSDTRAAPPTADS